MRKLWQRIMAWSNGQNQGEEFNSILDAMDLF
jgi:hypothetical protein